MKVRATRSSVTPSDQGGRGGWRADTTESEAFPPASQNNSKMDVDGHGNDMDTSEKPEGYVRKKPWEKSGVAGTKIKKKVPGAKNLKIRRYVQPKNAVVCLNELKPGLTYTMEKESGIGQPFCISVEVEGQKYRGYGSTRLLAKLATAEAALISFVKPPPANTETAKEDDKTPWATLASFAIYKLFNEWREGRVGMCSQSSQPPYGVALPPGFQTFGQAGTGIISASNPTPQVTNAIAAHLSAKAAINAPAFSDAIAAHLGGKSAQNNNQNDASALKPAKTIPENAGSMHPVMVLHQMHPGIQYTINQDMQENKPYFNISAEIDGQTFYGEGSSVKKAKFKFALEAVKALYQIDSTFEMVA